MEDQQELQNVLMDRGVTNRIMMYGDSGYTVYTLPISQIVDGEAEFSNFDDTNILRKEDGQ